MILLDSYDLDHDPTTIRADDFLMIWIVQRFLSHRINNPTSQKRDPNDHTCETDSGI